MQVDTDSLHIVEANFIEHVEILMVESTDGLGIEVEQVGKKYVESMAKKMKVVFPKAEEALIDFLNKCKLGNSKNM